jgi:hypothetical protein
MVRTVLADNEIAASKVWHPEHGSGQGCFWDKFILCCYGTEKENFHLHHDIIVSIYKQNLDTGLIKNISNILCRRQQRITCSGPPAIQFEVDPLEFDGGAETELTLHNWTVAVLN